MRFVARLLVLTGIAAVLLVPRPRPPTGCGSASTTTRCSAGTAAGWTRWTGRGATRRRSCERSSNGRRWLRAPGERDRPVRPGLHVRRRRRVRPERAGARRRGADHAVGHAGVGERRPEAAGDAAEPRGLPELRARGRVALLGPLRRLPFVRFYTIWNESNLATFLVPQFDSKGRIVSPANYAKLARSGIAGIRAGNSRALVAIGETSSNGRDKKRPADRHGRARDVHEGRRGLARASGSTRGPTIRIRSPSTRSRRSSFATRT